MRPFLLYDRSISKTTVNYYLRVNSIAATGHYKIGKIMKMAAIGHQQRPDAVVDLVKFNPATNSDVETTRLYN